MVQSKNKKILLHACCGICSGYPINYLKDSDYEPVVYFFNPNIDTEEEFNRRLNAQKTVCSEFCTELIAEPYNHKIFTDFIRGYECEPERGRRCDKCIELRLLKTAKKAKELDINLFTTTLVISPHKNYEKITNIGLKIAHDSGIEYLPQNFKKNDGFLKTNNISTTLGLYRQNYCGCEFAKGHLS